MNIDALDAGGQFCDIGSLVEEIFG